MPKFLKKICVISSIVIIIGGILTFIMTWNSIGFHESFLTSWISSFALCVAFIAPIGGIIAMLIHKVLAAILPNISKVKMNVVFGLCMAVTMESIMAVITTINTNSFSDWNHLTSVWASTLLAALPIGIVFSVIMSLIIKPKLEVILAE